MTTLIRSQLNVKPAQQHGVVTIGNFDGVHKGHQQLLRAVREYAKAANIPSIVVTFEPHPFEFFAGENLTIPRLTRLREKFLNIRAAGIDHVLVLPFNQQLANLSAEAFVTHILHETLKIKHIIVGDDFHFGAKRQGDFALLKKMGETLSFSATAMPTFMLDNERVSSTRIRQLLAEDDQVRIKQLLGRPYSMQGRVCHGDKLGRQLGFPTANIFLHRRLTPIKGIYVVYVHGILDHPLPGAANIGSRPTVDGTRTLLEVHLLDFNQDIYGRYVEVEFYKKLRDEVRYPTLDLLKQHIAIDIENTRNIIAKNK